MRSFFFCCFFAFATVLSAQFQMPDFQSGAALALGEISLITPDIAYPINPALLAQSERGTTAVHALQSYWWSEIRNYAASALFPTSSGSYGLRMQQLGIYGFRQNAYELAYGRSILKNLSIGLQLAAFHIKIAEYGEAWSGSYRIGLHYLLHESLSFSVLMQQAIQIPSPSQLKAYEQYRFGAQYLVSNTVNLYVEIEKNVQFPAQLKTGLSYQLMDQLALRVGFNTKPAKPTFGIGYKLGQQLQIDVGNAYHQQLGISTACSVRYYWK